MYISDTNLKSFLADAGLVSQKDFDAAEAEAKKSLVIARVEVSECCRITGLTPLDERAVAIQVDVVAEAGQLIFTERQLIWSLPPPLAPSYPGGTSHYVRLSPPFRRPDLHISRTGVEETSHGK